ncbi:MAG: DegT/DnrJ/EryC1/StrS family aminotransferase [Candidatus Omnitrophica bacterium]|nr:DegT/DnrJ/EryC1/StrS family aminotransferase [Candidatus Omnitrophota bacterium]
MPTPVLHATQGSPAILGGEPVRKTPYPEWPDPKPWMLDALKEVWASREWGVGAPIIDTFEEKWAEYVGVRYSGSCVNGTEAITVALRAVGVKQGDEVLTSPYTFIGTITPIMSMGAVPKFVDISESDYLMDLDKLEAAITERTRAIIPVHIAGCMVDMERVCAIAEKHNLKVIEDCAQAPGAEWKGRKAGAWGHAGTFSFQTSKNMSSGEGGSVTTDDPEIADGVFAAKNCGRTREGVWYGHSRFGSNLRLSAWQAALLLGQIDTLDEENSLRHKNALYLESILRGIEGVEAIAVDVEGVTRHAHHLVLFRYDSSKFEGLTRDQFTKAAQAEGIPVGNGYVPIYTQGCVREYASWPFIAPLLKARGIDYSKVSCPVTERVSRHEGFWTHMNVLMGGASELDSFAEAFRKIQHHAGDLKRRIE